MADWGEIRDLLEPQMCSSGHTPATMVENNRKQIFGRISTRYTCTTCEREIKYSIRKIHGQYEVRDMTVVNEGNYNG